MGQDETLFPLLEHKATVSYVFVRRAKTPTSLLPSNCRRVAMAARQQTNDVENREDELLHSPRSDLPLARFPRLAKKY